VLDEVPLAAGVLASPVLVALLVELLAPPAALSLDVPAGVVALASEPVVDAAGVVLAAAPGAGDAALIVSGLRAGAAFASNCAMESRCVLTMGRWPGR
jgi:hypothetical protein